MLSEIAILYENATEEYKERLSKAENDFTVLSIFVNPTQFDNSDDLKRYPRTIEQDIQIAKLRTEVYIVCIALLIVLMMFIGYRLAMQIKSNKQLAADRDAHLKRIASQNKILTRITYIQSHDLRGNVATILGLSKLFNFEDATDPFNKEIIHNIDMVATKMDGVVTDVINEENELMKNNI